MSAHSALSDCHVCLFFFRCCTAGSCEPHLRDGNSVEYGFSTKIWRSVTRIHIIDRRNIVLHTDGEGRQGSRGPLEGVVAFPTGSLQFNQSSHDASSAPPREDQGGPWAAEIWRGRQAIQHLNRMEHVHVHGDKQQTQSTVEEASTRYCGDPSAPSQVKTCPYPVVQYPRMTNAGPQSSKRPTARRAGRLAIPAWPQPD